MCGRFSYWKLCQIIISNEIFLLDANIAHTQNLPKRKKKKILEENGVLGHQKQCKENLLGF